jgi:steroid delta-isomerase-like uncharacterized protein
MMADAQTLKDSYTRLAEAVQAGDLSTVESALTEDYRWYGNKGQELDRAGLVGMVGGYVTAFPDMKFTMHSMIADGDMLAVMWTVSGTHTGPMGDIPATGKRIEMRGHVLCRYEGDKLAEEWELFDEALMLQQLGLGD